jgi:hypothetical protein
MKTPENAAGVATEEIMRAFTAFGSGKIVALETAQYNAVYKHVYKTLSTHMAPAEIGVRCFCSLCAHHDKGGEPRCGLPAVDLDDHGICVFFQRRPGG